jgi:iron complex transport system ATP-binding protein
MTVLRLDRVGVGYDDTSVLGDVDLTVTAGEWVALIGPNGAGKSTLLRACAGSLPHTGRVRVDGHDPRRLRPRELARRVALVPQQPLVPPGVTVTDYVLLGRTPYISYLGVESRHDLDVVADVLERLDLAHLADRRVDRLSGGELQRAVLARSLAQEAPLLLLDEPTSALDVGHQQHVLELVEGLRRERGLTVVSAMHDLTLAGQFADRLLLIDGGGVAAAGPARAVLTEDTIRRHYDASVRVLVDEDGGVVVIPMRARRRKLTVVPDDGGNPAATIRRPAP